MGRCGETGAGGGQGGEAERGGVTGVLRPEGSGKQDWGVGERAEPGSAEGARGKGSAGEEGEGGGGAV